MSPDAPRPYLDSSLNRGSPPVTTKALVGLEPRSKHAIQGDPSLGLDETVTNIF